MNQLRLDGRTAIVTGAGGNPSLGRAFAMLLAARGANVVVNDIGRDPSVPGYADDAPAQAVVDEITAAGGKAVADRNSVATEDGAQAIIRTAIDSFGGVDILINNAGVGIYAPVDQLSVADFQKQIDVNLMGTVWTCRAAWPHMRSQSYGRIVNIASSSLTGHSLQSAYSAGKGAVFSLTRALAAEGEALGIKVNTVNPGAYTRMVTATLAEGSAVSSHARDHFPAEMVAPVIVFLAHQDCPVTGECIESVGGTVRRTYLAQTEGFSDRALTVESVAQHWDEVMAGADPSRIAYVTLDPEEWQFRPYQAKA